MIASVEGTVGAVAFDSLVIEVGGLGYQVFASPAILASAVPGGRLKLHTYHLVREDQQALYGFRSADELGFFTLLLTVTGVGPKVALAIVGSRPTADLQLAIMTQDQAVLVSIPGIGKKLAERIIFELKEKVTAAGVAAAGTSRRRCATRARARSSPRCRRSATRSARPARRRASPWRTSAWRARSRSGSRPRCGASSGTSPGSGRRSRRPGPAGRPGRSRHGQAAGPAHLDALDDLERGGRLDLAEVAQVRPEGRGRRTRRRVLHHAADRERVARPEPQRGPSRQTSWRVVRSCSRMRACIGSNR